MPDETQQPEAASTEEAPKKKKSKRLLLIAAVVGFLVVAGGGAGWYFMAAGDEQPAEEAEATPEEPETHLVSLDSFIVNLANPKGDRFVKTTMRIITSDPDLPKAMTTDNVLQARVRDRIISVLTAKTFQDIASPIGKEALRREIAREIDDVLPNPAVQEVLFVEFVVQ
jgi:flagellar FliL protein